jgi:hypothetical protein
MPTFVNSKARRDKAKAKLTAVFGPEYSKSHSRDLRSPVAEVDRNVPIDFKVSNPMGCFQHLNRLQFPGGRKPKYVGQAMAPPPWWRQTEIMTAFDKIMADKVCLGSPGMICTDLYSAQEANLDPTIDSNGGKQSRSPAFGRRAARKGHDAKTSS